VPVDPLQRRPDHRALVPASFDDFTADRLSGAAQSLAHHCRLMVPCAAAQKMDAVDADTHLGMVAQVDQGVVGAVPAAAPASALACLAYRCLGLSAHGGSCLLAASVGAQNPSAPKVSGRLTDPLLAGRQEKCEPLPGYVRLAAVVWRTGEPGSGINMPTGIGRDDLQKLTGQGAQLVEVLPVEDYDWAHLPGAVNLPLKQLDTSTGRLDRSRAVIVYCQDWY
jgi:hypothetical protein